MVRYALLEGLETEVVVVEVAVHDDGRVERLLVLLDDFVHVVRDQAGLLAGLGVHVLVQLVDHLAEHLKTNEGGGGAGRGGAGGQGDENTSTLIRFSGGEGVLFARIMRCCDRTYHPVPKKSCQFMGQRIAW